MADDNTPVDNGANRNATMLGVRAIQTLTSTLARVFPAAGGTATSATGGSATLPAAPVGFITVTLPDGTAALVPYYAP
jgi:hypothetical protein